MRALVLSTTAVLLPILCVLGCKTTGRTKKMEYIQAYAGPRASDEDASLICIPRQLIKSVDGNTRYRLDVSGIDPREVLVMPGKHTVRLDARYYSRPPQTGEDIVLQFTAEANKAYILGHEEVDTDDPATRRWKPWIRGPLASTNALPTE